MSEPASREEALKKVQQMLHGIRFCMMTTVGDDGRLHSRPMATQQADFSGELWFMTSRSSLKTREVSKDGRVNLSYADPSSNRYVSLSGTAAVVEDRAKIDELWTVWYRSWFPKGKEDPEIVLVKVTAESAEYWDADNPAVLHLIGLVKATLTGKRPDAGEHGAVDDLH